MDINLLSLTPDERNPRRNRVNFSFFRLPNRAKNMEALLQLCAKTVLTVPGKDVFAPRYGGGLLSYKGKNMFVSDIPRIHADMAYIVKKSEELIISEQAIIPVGLQERLRALTLLSVEYIPEEGALDVSVLVESQAGEAAEISLANQLKVSNA